MTERIRQYATVVISLVVLCTSSVYYVSWAIDRNNHRLERVEETNKQQLCEALLTIIAPDPDAPPLTDRSKASVKALTDLTRNYGCDKGDRHATSNDQ